MHQQKMTGKSYIIQQFFLMLKNEYIPYLYFKTQFKSRKSNHSLIVSNGEV